MLQSDHLQHLEKPIQNGKVVSERNLQWFHICYFQSSGSVVTDASIGTLVPLTIQSECQGHRFPIPIGKMQDHTLMHLPRMDVVADLLAFEEYKEDQYHDVFWQPNLLANSCQSYWTLFNSIQSIRVERN